MRTRFIKINNISEVDTSKISVHDLNNRYIDRQGNMYGFRYNRISRKVEVIKIIRTPVKSADYYQHKLRQQKRDGVSVRGDKKYFDHDEDAEMGIEEELIADDGVMVGIEMDYNPDIFLEGIIEQMQTHASRLNGIIKNIRNSRVIPEGDRVNANQLEDLFRNVSIDGIQRIEKILSMHKELKEYPRSISYYLAKQNTRSKAIIDQLDTDTRKMRYIFLSEMYYSVSNLYRTLQKVLKDLNYFMENTHTEDIRDLTFAEKQGFQDAGTSVSNTIVECGRILKDLKKLDEYLSNADNF